MFKDEYKKDNDLINPDPAAVDALLTKMRAEAAKPRRSLKTIAYSLGTLAACAAVVICCVTLLPMVNNSGDLVDDVPAVERTEDTVAGAAVNGTEAIAADGDFTDEIDECTPTDESADLGADGFTIAQEPLWETSQTITPSETTAHAAEDNAGGFPEDYPDEDESSKQGILPDNTDDNVYDSFFFSEEEITDEDDVYPVEKPNEIYDDSLTGDCETVDESASPEACTEETGTAETDNNDDSMNPSCGASTEDMSDDCKPESTDAEYTTDECDSETDDAEYTADECEDYSEQEYLEIAATHSEFSVTIGGKHYSTTMYEDTTWSAESTKVITEHRRKSVSSQMLPTPFDEVPSMQFVFFEADGVSADYMLLGYNPATGIYRYFFRNLNELQTESEHAKTLYIDLSAVASTFTFAKSMEIPIDDELISSVNGITDGEETTFQLSVGYYYLKIYSKYLPPLQIKVFKNGVVQCPYTLKYYQLSVSSFSYFRELINGIS